MSQTPLRLHHIGEALVVTLLTNLQKAGKLSEIPCRDLNGDSNPLPEVLEQAGISGTLTFADNVAIDRIEIDSRDFKVDGESRIDCLVTDGSNGLGIEIKMGTTRLTTTSFTNRFLKLCDKDTHQPPRISGNMIAILDKRFASTDHESIKISTSWQGSSLPVSSTWLLMLRRKVWENWGDGRTGPVLHRCRIVIFEDIVNALGDDIPFDRVVSKVIGSGFAKKWGLA